MSASQTNLATLQYSNHAPQGQGHRSKLSWSGYTTPAGGSSANPSRTSLGQHPSYPPTTTGDDYSMSQLGSEVIIDGDDEDRNRQRRNSLSDEDEDEEERVRLREAEKRGWYSGRAF